MLFADERLADDLKLLIMATDDNNLEITPQMKWLNKNLHLLLIINIFKISDNF